MVPAPVGSGVPLNTAYHWYVIADQRVVKIDKDTYETVMEGTIQIFRDILKQFEEEANEVQQHSFQQIEI